MFVSLRSHIRDDLCVLLAFSSIACFRDINPSLITAEYGKRHVTYDG